MAPARPIRIADGIGWYPGLAIAAVTAGGAPPSVFLPASGIGGTLDLGSRVVPLDLRGQLPLDFYGPAGAIRTVSATAIEPDSLTGRIVFVGATSIGFGDRHATPFDATLPGVELHATLAANLIDGRGLRRDPAAWGWTAALTIAVAGAGFLALGIGPPAAMALAAATVTAATFATLQGAFLLGWWLDATTVLAALMIALGTGSWLLWFEQRRRATNLGQYQSPDLVDWLADEGTPRFSSETNAAVVLFVDVAGFTTQAEHLDPTRAETLLRVFHGLLERAATPTGGTIAHFAGDGGMIVFGLLKSAPDDAARALDFVERVFRAARVCDDWPGLTLRIGGHGGAVHTGLVGGKTHRHVSVSGDVVNTASRLQEFARQQGATLALSDAVVQTNDRTRHWAGRHGMAPTGPQTLRGRSTPIEIWIGSPAFP
jgi:adenylate cyclase